MDWLPPPPPDPVLWEERGQGGARCPLQGQLGPRTYGGRMEQQHCVLATTGPGTQKALNKRTPSQKSVPQDRGT